MNNARKAQGLGKYERIQFSESHERRFGETSDQEGIRSRARRSGGNPIGPVVAGDQRLEHECSVGGIQEAAGLCAELETGAGPAAALDSVRLLLLTNAWVARPLQADELAQGLPPLHSRPALQFAPVALTPDELVNSFAQTFGQTNVGGFHVERRPSHSRVVTAHPARSIRS